MDKGVSNELDELFATCHFHDLVDHDLRNFFSPDFVRSPFLSNHFVIGQHIPNFLER